MGNYRNVSFALTVLDKQNNETPTSQSQDSLRPIDKFTAEFQRNYIPTSAVQRFILSAGSSIASLIDPHRSIKQTLEILLFTKHQYTNTQQYWLMQHRHDMIACLGETTGLAALQHILSEMKATEEGRRILDQKPRINSRDIDLEALGRLPSTSFGYHYKQFLEVNVGAHISFV